MEYRATSCQYIGPDQDPIRQWPITYCGCRELVPGTSYCREHYGIMYMSGSRLSGKRKQRQIEAELRELELQRLIAEQEADEEVVNV